jgi:hypothetical protein
MVRLLQVAALIGLAWVLIAPPLASARPFGSSSSGGPLDGPSLRLPRRARYSIVVDPPPPRREAAIRGGDPEEVIMRRSSPDPRISFVAPALRRSAFSRPVALVPASRLRC